MRTRREKARLQGKINLCIAIIALLALMLICTINTLYEIGYFSNSCVNLNNIVNRYTDIDGLEKITVKTHVGDGIYEYDSYVIDIKGR